MAYETGDGVTQDYAEAVKWFRKAAEQGLGGAQYNLGRIHEKGLGVLPDMVAAHMWFSIAAKNGYSQKGEATAARSRDAAAGKLSRSDNIKSQRMAKRCMSSGYKDCD